MTALYIYATIIASPAFIVLIINCCRDVNLNEVYRIFPWVGIHSVVREASENPVIRRASLNISLSILFYFFNLYMIYYSTIFEVGNHLF